jgi:pimeloyl-ACP methyl ester carboxylesterase
MTTRKKVSTTFYITLHLVIAILLLSLCSCQTLRQSAESNNSSLTPNCVSTNNCSATDWLNQAQITALIADQTNNSDDASSLWLRCAENAYRSIELASPNSTEITAQLATRCTNEFLSLALKNNHQFNSGPMKAGNTNLIVEFRQLSPYVNAPISIIRASEVSMKLFDGHRFSNSGFGVAIAAISPRCENTPLCKLLPKEGVFRPMTAWIEADQLNTEGTPHLVMSDTDKNNIVQIGQNFIPLATDTSAPYANGLKTSALRRLGIFGLFGGRELANREGVYLLEDYDPNKRPIVMIHGLGSSPFVWARMTNAILGDPDLHAKYQVWHIVYQTNAPLLITRLRIQKYLDAAWQTLDPEGDDPARSHMVFIGHSLGGVVTRLLCADSKDILWDAAFLVPPESLQVDVQARSVVEGTFRFKPYPGIVRAIFIAAPHHGAPTADRWIGRFARTLVGKRTPEVQALKRLTQQNPAAVREELRDTYLHARLNSISTLQTTQPVRLAGQSLLPAAGIFYHTIAGVLPGKAPESDGAVPLSSTALPNTASTLVVSSDHSVPEKDAAIAEVIRILREDLNDGAKIE